MSTLVVLLLLAPALGAVAAAVVPDRAAPIGAGIAAAVGVGWVVVTAGAEAVTVGELELQPLAAATAAGLAVLVLGSRPATLTGTAAALLTLTVLPAAAALDPGRLPDRRLAAGVVLVAVLGAVRLLAERGPRLGGVVVVVAAFVVASGLSGDEAADAVALAVAGTLVAVVAAAVWGAPGRLLLPAALLAVARAADVRPAEADTDVALLVVAGLLAVGAGVLVVVRRRPVVDRLPLAAALVAAGLLALDLPELRAAGALLAGGALLALASEHPLGLAALAPGLAAAVQVAGLGSEPEHAAVAAAALALLAAGAAGRTGAERRPQGAAALAAVAVAFAVLPSWGWSGADTEPYVRALVVAVAAGVPVLLLGALVEAGAVPEGATRALRHRAGTLVRRPRADPRHGSAPLPEPLAEAPPQEEAGLRAP